MTRVRAALDRGLGGLLALLMAAAVANVAWQVFSRFALASPSSFTDELARYLLVWIGLLGAAYATGGRLHVAVDVLPRGLPARLERALAVGVQLAILLFALGVMGGGGLGLVWLSLDLGQRSAALGLPMGVVYLALPLSGLLIGLYSLTFLTEAVRPPSRAPSTEADR